VPEFSQSDEIVIDNIVHPLLSKPVANTVTLKRSSLITGSNASGKSTFVKAVAINAILAQTIHTCLAKQFIMKPCFVVTSMAVSDDIMAGDSYYIAEIKSLKRVLEGLNGDVRCLCFIDEILKGTNTIERIAASASILKFLSSGNCLAIAATHDIELTEMAESYFDNYHFQEHISNDGISFDYEIYDGRSTTKNAIQLLKFMHYDAGIIKKADELASTFERDRTWQKL
jgi:DNA mismatch repair ATPase MutS